MALWHLMHLAHDVWLHIAGTNEPIILYISYIYIIYIIFICTIYII